MLGLLPRLLLWLLLWLLGLTLQSRQNWLRVRLLRLRCLLPLGLLGLLSRLRLLPGLPLSLPRHPLCSTCPLNCRKLL